MTDGLAVYSTGQGEPLLLFPYPHALSRAPMAQSPLAEQLVETGCKVLTFDPPGAYRSAREPAGDMAEMLACAGETLDAIGVEGPVDVAGHSMGALCALAFAAEHPERTKRLILVGGMSGFPAVARWGFPGSKWNILDGDYWRLVFWGIRVKSGRGNLALFKKLGNLMTGASYNDPSLFTPVNVDKGDKKKSVPLREVLWGKEMVRRLSYAGRLREFTAPTLLIAGRFDPMAPLPCSEELLERLPDARLVIFEASGHYPFVEEPWLFGKTVVEFLRPDRFQKHF